MAIDLKKLIKDVHNKADTIITKPLKEHYLLHGDDPYDPEIAEWVARQLQAVPRDRSGSFSASSATRCLREQELGFLGMPSSDTIDPQLRGIFNDGKWRHIRWQADLLQAGLITRPEAPMQWKKMKLLGSADAVGEVYDDHPRVKWRGKAFGVELKGTNMFVYKRSTDTDELKEEHLGQIARYFLMSDLDLFIVLYEDKNSQEFSEWVVEPEVEMIQEQREELLELNQAIDTKLLHPMLDQCKRGFGKFKECPYGGHGNACATSRDWPNLKKRNP